MTDVVTPRDKGQRNLQIAALLSGVTNEYRGLVCGPLFVLHGRVYQSQPDTEELTTQEKKKKNQCNRPPSLVGHFVPPSSSSGLGSLNLQDKSLLRVTGSLLDPLRFVSSLPAR
ncbi:hypothetical protein CEXT_750461 [Caerostris extrusa]|uniref:Uncharacterized protein n=1 Tax=Caerostris extrusa TaxID=172846 RepID=A0AAV4TPL0_CAEEX|nr:hypothetical protein CEXT_750461 [Caerostris extrusa]